MHAATTKTRDFPGRIQTRYWLIIRLQHPTGEVSFHPSQGFASENGEPHGNQGTRSRIEQSVRLRHAKQSISQIRTRSSAGNHLGIVTERVRYLAITGDNFLLQFAEVNQVLSRQVIHGTNQIGKAALHYKIHAFALECLNGARSTGQDAAE